ncbi:hypothetical protein DFQ27_006535 [Actinomortierella ambigua]|uniref:Glutathione S-transferase n=1 Tax=Actinomortierella ambigua TaxID=1343610 RepID=A0A9P6U1C3_9FUNG|nr:hypothetical protein DFQ26_005385 [Actinomortierella ambigua]KAG0254954.1 hypothetical protein DFQ27_006535 [Actinomortierella ambigua]
MSPKYQIHYFGVHGVVAVSRAMLCIAGADWSQRSETFDSWPAVKASTPFGTLPIMNVTSESGEVTVIPESMAIERYLAKKFDMVGSTEAEQIQVDVALSLNNSLSTYWIQRVMYAAPEATAKAFDELKTSKLPTWIASCEKVLAKNGSNGHFVGDKITVADISASALMDALLPAEGVDAVLNEKTAPNLFAVKRKVDGHPKYLAYRKSDEFAQMSEVQSKFVTKFGFDMKKIHVVA